MMVSQHVRIVRYFNVYFSRICLAYFYTKNIEQDEVPYTGCLVSLDSISLMKSEQKL